MLATLYFCTAMHVGFGLAHVVALYFIAGTAWYGGEWGFLYYTPLQDFVAMEAETNSARQVDPLQVGRLFHIVKDLGDTINTLFAYDYELLEMIDSDDGMVYWLSVLLLVISWGGISKLGFHIVQLVLSSGILNSTTGVALVLGGVGVGTILSLIGGFT